MKKGKVNLFNKGQFVRLLDVFALGPFMINFAYEAGSVTEFEKAVIASSGLTTILYNGQNYLGTAGFKIPPTNAWIYAVIWIAGFVGFYSNM